MTTEEERKMLEECVAFNRCDKIVEQYWNLVYRIVQKIFTLKNAPLVRELIEEVQQEVFFQLLDDNRRRLRMYKDEEGHTLSRWIILIANRTTLNYLRKKGYDGLLGQKKKVELSEHFGSETDLEEKVLDEVSLNAALSILTKADRIIFKLHRYGLSARDIAKVMNSTEGAVNNKIYRIKKNLKKYVTE